MIISIKIRQHVGLFFMLIFFGCGKEVQKNTENPLNFASKPNILFIIVDDLNDWVGYLDGHPQAITPNIDRLASRGISFTNAHTNAPLCGPSRSSMLTGLRPSTSGIYFHIGDPDLVKQVKDSTFKVTLLPDYFEQNGYKSLGVGKIFHWGDAGKVFDEYGGLSNFGPRPEKRFKYDPTWFDKPKGTSTDWGVFPEHDSLTFDKRIADWAVDKLSKKHEKPFFLATGFMRPHVPWYVPQKWFDQFNLDSIKTPVYNEGDLNDVPEVARLMTNWPMMPEMEWMLEENRWEEAVQAYLASVYFVDYQIGRVLNALENSAYADNTIIVLTSDHGYHMGEKGLFQKGTLWQRSTQVPMIWAGKGIMQGETNEPASLLDIYPTLLDFTETQKLDYLEGTSLKPILTGQAEFLGNTAITTFGFNNHSVFDKDWHYIKYNDGSEELYHLVNDSGEWQNLANVDSLKAIKNQYGSKLPKINNKNNQYSHFNAAPYFVEEAK